MKTKLKLTEREDFLMNIQAYLMNGGWLFTEFEKVESRTQREALEIMNDPDLFNEIDVLKDELSYFGLDKQDFVWEVEDE